MKLDRNVNPDGRGKYALINLRTNTVDWGNASPSDQFFVMRYRDRFTHAGLTGYAKAIGVYLESPGNRVTDSERAELLEYKKEIEREAARACSLGNKTPD